MGLSYRGPTVVPYKLNPFSEIGLPLTKLNAFLERINITSESYNVSSKGACNKIILLKLLLLWSVIDFVKLAFSWKLKIPKNV